MSKQIDALKLALEALETDWGTAKAITAIKEALSSPNGEAQPDQDQDEVDIRSRLYQRIHELETQLSQPEHEPVAYQDTADKCRLETVPSNGGLLPQRTDEEEYLSKAYRLANELRCYLAIAPAPQRTWVGLTTDDWDEIKKQVSYNFEMTTGEYAERISHLVEDRLQEKNT